MAPRHPAHFVVVGAGAAGLMTARELARHADDYYNRVAAAHWSGPAPAADSEPFMHKQYRGVSFIANGYDFWFAKAGLSLVDCAAITLLDYFN